MNDKKTLITIIVLLVIFVPLTAIGCYKHFSASPTKKTTNVVEDDNVNHEFIYNNKVYFYLNDKLLGTYACSNCKEFSPIIDDTTYHTHYYKYGEEILNSVINDTVAVFMEGEQVNYYNIASSVNIARYDAMKTYNTSKTSDIVIAESNGKWGVILLFPPTPVISFSYDYLALPAHFDEDKLKTNHYIGLKDNTWYIISDTEDVIASSSQEIVDFNNDYYVTYEDGYHIYNMMGDEEYLSEMSKNNVYMIDNYIIVILNNNLFVYDNPSETFIKFMSIEDYEDIYFKNNGNNIDMYIDGKLSETIEIA